MSCQKDSARRLEFKDLPPELRDLVWEFSLPTRRVFHVKGISGHHEGELLRRAKFFRFHIRHAPPAALSTCKESRAVALRSGFFLSPYGEENPGVWFSTEHDVLYFDRNQRNNMLQLKPNLGRMAISGLDRVRNVGVEWRAFFRDTPRQGATTSRYWRAAIETLYVHMPQMRTVNYILPMLRHKGGMMWGREPYQAQNHEAVLVTLPDKTQIPWENTRNRGADRVQLLNDIRHENGLNSMMVTWKEVKEDIEKGFREEAEPGDGWQDRQHDTDHYPPEVIGWWLLRDGVATDQSNPQIQTFAS